jgi:hypothetical protein
VDLARKKMEVGCARKGREGGEGRDLRVGVCRLNKGFAWNRRVCSAAFEVRV